MAKSFKKSDESFNNNELLSESFADIMYKEHLKRLEAQKPVEAKKTVFLKSKRDIAEQNQEDEERAQEAAEQALEDADLLDSEDEDLMEENDPELARIKARRMAELRKAFENAQSKKQLGHGDYVEIAQDEFLPNVTKSPFVVCHFYHREFERCKIIDKHLDILSKKHFDCKFIRIDAEKSHFFVQKLGIRVLPCVVCFVDGVSVDRIIGFEDFAGKDDFSTKTFEIRLWKSGCIVDGEGHRYKHKAKPMKTLLDNEF